MKNELKYLLKPSSVAVIGASNKIENAGYSVFRNLKGNFTGKLFAVNPNRKKIQGFKSYSSVYSIKEKIDLAIIVTPAPTVIGVVKECVKARVKAVVIISAGFKASGKAGEKLIKEVVSILKKNNIRMLGPNCLGFINPHLNINASFAKTTALPGKIAFISQSGALCSSILDWAYVKNVGFSYFVSVGDMADISYSDLIDYFSHDSQVSSIIIYMESLAKARSFMSSARAFARKKPIIILKSGTSQEGAHAAQSHTGNLAGNDEAFDAAFRRAGILRVNSIEELFDAAQTLSLDTKVTGNKLVIVTNAGGPGVIATDALIKNGGALAQLSENTNQNLQAQLPKNASIKNPVDLLGDAGPELFKTGVEIVLGDEHVDGVIVIITPQTMTDCPAIARALAKIKNPENKPVLTCFMGEKTTRKAAEIVGRYGMRNYESPEDAIISFLNMYRYTQNIQLLYATPSAIPSKFTPNIKKARLLMDIVIKKGRTTLTERQAKKLLSYYDIPVTENYLARSLDDVEKYVQKTGYPAIMKIVSPDILHKTEVGGYRAHIHSKEKAKKAYTDILASVKKTLPDARIDGVLIEKMQKKKYELFLGSKKDPLFGPIILFGMGGTAVEVYKDTSSELPPLNMMLARNLIARTKVSTLLEGFRSVPGARMTELKFILYKFAYLVSDFPEISDIDINPLTVDEDSEMVLDAKIILDKNCIGKRIRPHSHLVVAPYPSQYIKEIQAKDGKKVTFRPVKPEDEFLLAEFFTTFSPEAQEFCYSGRKKSMTHETLSQFTNIDYDREIALVAEIQEDGRKRIIGDVRISTDFSHEKGELTLIVGDPWRRLGIGSKLLQHCLSVAKKEGIRHVYSYAISENSVLLEMYKKKAFKIGKERGYYKAELVIY